MNPMVKKLEIGFVLDIIWLKSCHCDDTKQSRATPKIASFHSVPVAMTYFNTYKMVPCDGLLNAFHSLNFCRLTHPTNFAIETRNRVCLKYSNINIYL